MKKSSLWLLLMLLCFCSLFALVACSDEEPEEEPHVHSYGVDHICTSCGNVWEYTEGLEIVRSKDGFVVVCGIGSATDKDIVLPYYYEGQPITNIQNSAFLDCSHLTSITIPSNVVRIGENAFKGCSGLTFVSIPSSVTSIGKNAFYGCSGLTTIAIPSSVTSIGEDAFYGCSGLTTIEIPSSITSIEHGTFEGCSGLTSATVPSSVTSIGGSAFKGCSGLTTITIPSSITSIEYSTFGGCTGLTSITIPSNVTSIGANAFEGCSGLTSVIIPSSVADIGKRVFSRCSALERIEVDILNDAYYSQNNCIIEKASGTLIAGCNNSTIPGNGCVTRIEDGSFEDCDELRHIEIPASVKSIGVNAFASCDNLMFVDFLNNSELTVIEDKAFLGCYNLLSIVIPETAKIEYRPFEGCHKLIAKTFAEARNLYTNDQGYVFYSSENEKYLMGNAMKQEELVLPEGTYEIYPYAFYKRNDITSVTIPVKTSIGEYAFSECQNLQSLELLTGEALIKKNAFAECINLTTITNRQKPVYDVEKDAFLNCPYWVGTKYLNVYTQPTFGEFVSRIEFEETYGEIVSLKNVKLEEAKQYVIQFQKNIGSINTKMDEDGTYWFRATTGQYNITVTWRDSVFSVGMTDRENAWKNTTYLNLLPEPSFGQIFDVIKVGYAEYAYLYLTHKSELLQYVETLEKAGFSAVDEAMSETAFGMVNNRYTVVGLLRDDCLEMLISDRHGAWNDTDLLKRLPAPDIGNCEGVVTNEGSEGATFSSVTMSQVKDYVSILKDNGFLFSEPTEVAGMAYSIIGQKGNIKVTIGYSNRTFAITVSVSL